MTAVKMDVKVSPGMRRMAEKRRHAGPVNGARLTPDAPLPPLKLPEDYPEDYREWWEIEAQREDARGWAEPAPFEYRNGGWYHMETGKRIHTPSERGQAIAMYLDGRPVTEITARFECAPSTVRQWVHRMRQDDLKVSREPRFRAA